MFTPLPVRSARSGWTFFILYDMAKTVFNGQSLTSGPQIQLLKSRGLSFINEPKAQYLLDNISYAFYGTLWQ